MEDQILKDINKYFAESSSREILRFVQKVRYLAIQYLKNISNFSERYIAIQMGISNTRISQIIATFKDKVKLEGGVQK